MKHFYSTYIAIVMTIASLVKSEFIESCTQNKTIALTFDDGPYKYTKEFVDYLKTQDDVKVTFFTVAKFHYPFATDVSEYQEAMKSAHDAGFQIASHTYKHKISSDYNEFKKSLTKNDDFIEKVTGDRPRYFRAPKGHCSEHCQEKLDEWGYRLIQWDVDTSDWDLESSGSASRRIKDSIKILKKSFAEEKDNYLILMHDTESYTVSDIAKWIIEESGMREKGYRFVTVAECLGDKKGMYTSGRTYGDNAVTVSSSMITGNVTDHIEDHIDHSEDNSVVMDEYNIQNLTSSAFSIKPISFLLYIGFALLMYIIV